MTQPAKVQEPSMEEILASIRRIIADDEAKPAEPKPTENTLVDGKPDAGVASGTSELSKSDTSKLESVRTPVVAGGASASVRSISTSDAKPTPAPTAGQTVAAKSGRLDAVPPASRAQTSSSEGDVFELTDDMALPDPVQAPFRKVDPQDDLEFSESASRFKQSSFAPPLTPAPDLAAQLAPNILSRSTVSAVESAFNSLANTVLSNNARTLEDLVREMLRPMLKTWLDDNLPGVVERMVKAEIERVSRGR